jgi:hypothetical protein
VRETVQETESREYGNVVRNKYMKANKTMNMERYKEKKE